MTNKLSLVTELVQAGNKTDDLLARRQAMLQRFEVWESTSAEAIAEAGKITAITSKAELEDAGAALQLMKEIAAEVERSRKAWKAPVLQLGRAIDGKCKGLQEPLAEAEARLKGLCTAYHAQMRAEAAKRDQEAQEKAAAAQEASAAAGMPVRVEAPPPRPVLKTHGATTLRQTRAYRIVDVEKLPRQYLLPNPKALRAAAQCDPWPEVPGVEFFLEDGISVKQ